MLRDHQPPDGTKTALDPRVEALLSAAAAPSDHWSTHGEREALAEFRAVHARKSKTSRLASVTTLKAAAAAAVGAGLLVSGGVAAAVTGSLPGPAQDTAQVWLDTVGVSVPGAGGHEVASMDDDPAQSDSEAARDADLPASAEHGSSVAETARDTEASGAEKGAEISEQASQGRSKAGDDHPDGVAADGDEGEAEGAVSEEGRTHANVEVPNHGRAAHDDAEAADDEGSEHDPDPSHD